MLMLKKSGPGRSGWLRVLVFLALAAILPACSYSRTGKTYPTGGGPVGGAGTVTLLSDAFVNPPGPLATSDPNWTASTDSGTGANVVFPGPYFLDFTLTTRSGSVALHSTATTALSFASKPVTFTLSFQPPTAGTFPNNDLMSIIIKDAGSATVVAQADLNETTGLMSFNTNGSMTSTTPTAGALQNVVFSIDASGNATWSVGSGFTSAPVLLTPPAMLSLVLKSTYTAGPGGGPAFRFGSVLVTTP
jgi:hypothetical protein